MKSSRIILSLVFLISLQNFTFAQGISQNESIVYQTDEDRSMATFASDTEFKIMQYNVQNLFDAEHDEGKLDHTFLPINFPGKALNCQKLSNNSYRTECLKMNWTDEKIELKINQIKKVVDAQGSLPDMIALEEVENESVVKRLGEALGYSNFVMTDSPDQRGVDVALLFNQDKLEYLNHQEIDLSSYVGFETRNILKVHFRPKRGHNRQKKIIGVYVNHWPSQAKGSVTRFTAARLLAQTITEQTNIIGAENYYVIATGDFNTTDQDSPHPFHDLLTGPYRWDLFLYDVHQLSEREGNPMRYQMPPGTYWYQRDGSYSRFDRFFISQNIWGSEGITLIPRSYRIVGMELNSIPYKYRNRSPDFYPINQLVPFKYDHNTTNEDELGFADHYPVTVKFKMQ